MVTYLGNSISGCVTQQCTEYITNVVSVEDIVITVSVLSDSPYTF